MENKQLLDLVGETYTEKLQKSISKEYWELKKKTFPNSENPISTNCIVSVMDKGESEIKSIGMSCINDLLLDNFGILIQQLLRNGSGNFTMTRTGGSSDNFNMSSFTTSRVTPFIPVGSRIQLGKGLSPAQRTDNQIEIAFTNGGLEDTARNTMIANLNKLTHEVKVPFFLSPTGGAGAISEVMLFFNARNTIATVGGRELPFAHDNISPIVNFTAGQTITLDYLINYG